MSGPPSPDAMNQSIPTTPAAENSQTTPTTNGINGINGTNGVNGDEEGDSSARPSLQKSLSSTQQEPPVDAEACKALGNKFFKTKQYEKAIEEYTKGSCGISYSIVH